MPDEAPRPTTQPGTNQPTDPPKRDRTPLSARLKQSSFESPAHEATLALVVAANYLNERIEEACHTFGLTSTQYNVLRVLRGAHPRGLPRYDILDRLVERGPDVTRLLDKLEARGFIKRVRSEEDRRLSIAKITGKGLALLGQMQPSINEVQYLVAERTTLNEQKMLTRVCNAIIEED